MEGIWKVGEEGLEEIVGKRMIEKWIKSWRRRGKEIGEDEWWLIEVIEGKKRRGKNLGEEIVIVVNSEDLGNKLNEVDEGIIKKENERRNEGWKGIGRKKRMIGREEKSNVEIVELWSKGIEGIKKVEGERKIDEDIVRDNGDKGWLFNNMIILGRGKIGGKREIEDVEDLIGELDNIKKRFKDEGRVGGKEIEKKKVVEIEDLIEIRSVKEKINKRVNK